MLTPGKHHWLRPGYYNTPSFRQICRDSWLNILTETLCVIISILLWRLCPPLIPHYFPYFEGVETHPIGLKYSQPLREEYINTIMMAAISFLVPSSIMLVMNLWVLRDYCNWDASVGIFQLPAPRTIPNIEESSISADNRIPKYSSQDSATLSQPPPYSPASSKS